VTVNWACTCSLAYIARMDYQIAPVQDNEAERLAALQSAICAFGSREERFDRIISMAQRMLHVPRA
jgi:hypothetical protein